MCSTVMYGLYTVLEIYCGGINKTRHPNILGHLNTRVKVPSQFNFKSDFCGTEYYLIVLQRR
jgi:hypothetical protein